MASLRTKTSQVFWISFIAAWLTLCGCASPNITRPLSCKEIHQVPGLEDQLRNLPQGSPAWHYIIESSAVCHGNKKIR